MRIAVCDDEKREADVLKHLLEEYFEGSCDIDVFYSGEKLAESKAQYDIYFLDIEIGDANGIAIAEKIREKDIQAFLVFVTNYEDFYRRAFAVHAFEYVVKPIGQEALFKILDEILIYKTKDRQNKEVYFRGINGLVRVSVNQICYFEFMDRKIKMVLDHDIVWLKGTIKEIGNAMEQYDFVIPHKAYVVNMRKIKEIKRYDMIMVNEDQIPIAQKKASDFREQFESYLYNQV